jgi:uncharacterized membrane protein (UPF0127 family)
MLAHQELIISRLKKTETFKDRLIGLLGKEHLSVDSGLLITPCNQVHTFFMKFSIDVVFLDRTGKVLKVYSAFPPWRMSMMIWKAKSVLELASGQANSLSMGDYIIISGQSVFKSNTSHGSFL